MLIMYDSTKFSWLTRVNFLKEHRMGSSLLDCFGIFSQISDKLSNLDQL